MALKHVPLLVFFIAFPTMITIYFVSSVGTDDTPLWLPYVSESGTHSPASCIFTFGMCITACIGGFVILLMNRVLTLRISQTQDVNKKIGIINEKSTRLFFPIVIGLIGLSSFQMSNVLAVHLFFASVFFGFAVIYMYCLWFMFHLLGDSNLRQKLRLLFAVLATALMFGMMILYLVDLVNESALCEILMILAFQLFFITLSPELENSKVSLILEFFESSEKGKEEAVVQV
eukprot:GCRY01001698.1.p1 GENE.GCRY01001698.1~~GCRY01001698.1.p1  ORF type:complete len:231 (+),score=31.62 GCRY01001698.1:151-843(+)